MKNRLSFAAKLSYGVGAFGKDLVYALVATFFLYYLTDVCGVSPLFAGTLFLIARIFDAVNDPVMGLVVDNTHSRWGKFRPWILLGTILNAVVLALLFFNPGLSGNALAAWLAILYILWGLTYTIMDIPYWSLVPALSSNESERDLISAIPRIFASAAWLVIGTFGLAIVTLLGGENGKAHGFALFGLIVAILFVLCSLITVIHVRERVHHAGKSAFTGFRAMGRILFRNGQVITTLAISLLFNIMFQLSNGFAIYYFKYALGKEELFSRYLFAAGIAQLAGLFLYAPATKLLGRKTVFSAAALLPAAGFLLLALAGAWIPLSAPGVMAASAVINLGVGLMLAILTAMLADVVDYGEFLMKTRNESIIFSTQTFVVKLAGAFSGFLTGAGLSFIGYLPDVRQTPGTILGIRIMMIAFPVVLSLLSFAVYWKFYRLNGRFLRQVADSIRIQHTEEKEAGKR